MIIFNSFGESDVSGSGPGSTGFSFTNTSGTFMLAVIMLDSLTDTISGSSIFYNSVNLTQLYLDISDTTTRLWVGYLNNPSTGANTFTANFSGSPTVLRLACITFTGVDQTTPIGGSNSTKFVNDTATPKGTTVTVSGTSGTVVDFWFGTRNAAGNAASPQVEKMNNTGSWNGGTNHLGGISYATHTGSNVTMNWENLTYDSSPADQIQYAVELLPQISTFMPKMEII